MSLSRGDLYDLYVVQRFPVPRIAEMYGVTRGAIYNWLKADGISRNRPSPEGPPRPRPAGAELRRLYDDEVLGLDELARRFGRRRDTIKLWLVEAGAEIRSRGYGPSHAMRHPRPSDEQLRIMYVREHLPTPLIAEKCGVTEGTVYRWISRAGIRRGQRPRADDAVLRHLYVDLRLSVREIGEHFDVGQTTAYWWLVDAQVPMRQPGGSDEPVRRGRDELRELYVHQGLSLPELARLIGVRSTTVRGWLVDYGIEIRQPGGQPGAGALPRPAPEVLRRLYADELASTGEVAEWCDVGQSSVIRWLHDADVPMRPPGRSVQRRGHEPPSKEELFRLAWEEYLSYEQIAALYGADTSAVPHWLDKYRVPRHSVSDVVWKGVELTKEEFAARYEAGESLKSIAADFTASWQTVRELAIAWGAKLRPSGWYFGPPIVCADGHVVRSTYERRVDDWLNEQDLEHEYEPRTPFPSRWRADFRVGDVYIEVWGVRDKLAYEAKKRTKIQAYEDHGVQLIELPYWVFPAREKAAFERRLAPLLMTDEPTSDNSQDAPPGPGLS